MRRAAHQLYDEPLVFDDPLAVTILGQEYRSELQRTPRRADRPFSVALRAFLVARSKYAEDTLLDGVVRGVTQYVLLGAGLETFAYRNPFPGLRVFEVDRPATQIWKRNLLLARGIATPPSLGFVPVDFERDGLTQALAQAGFNRRKKTVFAWLGVVPYLTREAFRSTLGLVSSMPPGSGLALDYAQPREVLPPTEQLEHDSLASRVRQAGEPFQLFMTAQGLRRELQSFVLVEDLGSTEINSLYFAGRNDLLFVQGAARRLARAWL